MSDHHVIMGRITYASATVPTLRANLRYSAMGVGGPGAQWSATNDLPLNRIVSLTEPRLLIVPAKVGDPCLLVRDIGVTKIIALTEEIQTEECPA